MSQQSCVRHDGAVCRQCAEEQRPNEAVEQWLARLGAIVRADLDRTDACANGHPWTTETIRYTRTGCRICRACTREANRRHRLGVEAVA